jgi:S1-C subfamily serine protease
MLRLASVLMTTLLLSLPASAWTVKEMNDTINSANFIVNRGCSGTLISKEHRLILTNHHCLKGGITTQTKKIVDGDGKISSIKIEVLKDLDVAQRAYDKHQLVGQSSYKAQIVARWKASDLALLQVRSDIPNGIEVKVFAGDEVLRGETVYVVGNPFGLDATVTKGIISSTTRMFDIGTNADVSFLQLDAGMAPGNSGGSLFNNNGEMIGVPAAGFPNNGHLGLAIPFFRIQEFLTDNCWGEVWDVRADSYEVCINPEEEKGETE